MNLSVANVETDLIVTKDASFSLSFKLVDVVSSVDIPYPNYKVNDVSLLLVYLHINKYSLRVKYFLHVFPFTSYLLGNPQIFNFIYLQAALR